MAAGCHDGAMAAECLFCRIAAGRENAAIVFDDDRAVAFLDHRPLFPGHVLLVPRLHVETQAMAFRKHH